MKALLLFCLALAAPAHSDSSAPPEFREGLRRRKPWGFMLGFDDPLLGLQSLGATHQLTEFLRLQLHLAEGSNRAVVATVVKLFVPHWPVGPTIGLGYLARLGSKPVYSRLESQAYMTFGLDYLFESGFYTSLGFNHSLRDKRLSNPYFELGYFL